MTSRLEKNKKERRKIERSERRKKRKAALINFLKIFFGFSIIILSISSYIYYASTSVISVREYSNIYNTLPKEFHGFKIVQFGDLYYDNNYSKTIEILVKKINILKPDLIVFTGGLINKNYSLKETSKNKLETYLSKIKSSVGKYYVVGDNDNEDVVEILNNSGFKLLDNSSELIYYNSTTPILLHGITDNYDIKYKENNKLFKINILHDAKKTTDILSYNSPEIIMAGKTLNGQVRIPYQDKILKEKDELSYKKTLKLNNTDIFITGGIGTNNLPIRLFNHPSINFYRLRTH